MKILFLTNAFENIIVGPAKFANLILQINQLYHSQHEIRILTEDVSESRLADLQYVYKVKLGFPQFLKPIGQVLRMFIYYREAQRIRKEYNFDLIVYINSFNGLWASLLSDKPTVGMINDEKNLNASLSNIRMDKWWVKKFVFGLFERLSARYHRLIITNSDYLTRKVIEEYKLPARKVHKLYKAISFSGIPFNPDRNFKQPIQVLFVKADYRVGRLDILVQALDLLDQYQFRLTVIGPEKHFENHVHSLGRTTDNVQLEYLGPQPQQVVYEHLRTYDLFCVPSYTEALGVANIEALAFGIPVVSTRVGGIPEVLHDGNNGWLVEPNNIRALSVAIQECVENENKRKRQAENGRLFVRKFSEKAMCENFIAILQEVCK